MRAARLPLPEVAGTCCRSAALPGRIPLRDALPEPSAANPGSGGRNGPGNLRDTAGPETGGAASFFVLWVFGDVILFGVFLVACFVFVAFLFACLAGWGGFALLWFGFYV